MFLQFRRIRSWLFAILMLFLFSIPENAHAAALCGYANGNSYSSAPQAVGSLCATGMPSTVSGPGPWYWSCNDGGSVANCSSALCGGPPTCGSGEVLVEDYETVMGIGATWPTTNTNPCPAGTVYGAIDDSNGDTRHSISEEHSESRVVQRLCFTNVPAEAGLEFGWFPVNVPSGWVYGGIRDDEDPYHATGEQDGAEGRGGYLKYGVRVTNPNYVVSISRVNESRCNTVGSYCAPGQVGFIKADNSDDTMESDEDDDERTYSLWLRKKTVRCEAVWMNSSP